MPTQDMPIQQPHHDQSGPREVRVRRVPMSLFRGCDEWCQKFHGQSLERIAERGGFDAHEALRVVCNLVHHPAHLSNDDAHRILYAMVVMYRRGQRSIVEGTDTLPTA